ncbi:hypothetical protein ACQEV4_01900 [Streptomyces shenzhenensis]|uniref:hypothetical protein n=1 Tax=Streptomyces shenzhenensis TaxID=943815 RepID=UPI003D922FFC
MAVTGLGDIEVPVDTVGHGDRRGGGEMPPAELGAMLDVRLTSAYALSRIVARGTPGRIIKVSSALGQFGRTRDVAHVTAEAGLDCGATTF